MKLRLFSLALGVLPEVYANKQPHSFHPCHTDPLCSTQALTSLRPSSPAVQCLTRAPSCATWTASRA